MFGGWGLIPGILGRVPELLRPLRCQAGELDSRAGIVPHAHSQTWVAPGVEEAAGISGGEWGLTPTSAPLKDSPLFLGGLGGRRSGHHILGARGRAVRLRPLPRAFLLDLQ